MHFDIAQVQDYQWALAVFSALVIGMAKAGLNGMTLLFIPLMALSFGSKTSTGIVLPMLCVGDFIAVAWYRRHAEIQYLLQLLPSTLIGIGIGVAVGGSLSDGTFRYMLGGVIVVLLALMIWQDRLKDERLYPHAWWFAAVAGLLAGFTTMVGNAAGAIMSIYLLSMRLPKNAFIGTTAWFFLVVNLLKIPLQVFFWKNMSVSTITFDALMIPAIVVGAIVGIKVAGKIPEKAYRVFVMVMTGAAAVMLFIL